MPPPRSVILSIERRVEYFFCGGGVYPVKCLKKRDFGNDKKI